MRIKELVFDNLPEDLHFSIGLSHTSSLAKKDRRFNCKYVSTVKKDYVGDY
jgi:hypothetical protein